MTAPRKRVLHPHQPLAPLQTAILRARTLSATLDLLETQRQLARTSLGKLPAGISLHALRCRQGCAACPHLTFRVKGKEGLAQTRAIFALSKKNSKIRKLLLEESRISHLALLAQKAIRKLHPDPFRPDGPYTPIPFHVFAWRAVSMNRQVIDFQRELRDWNAENNRAAKGKVVRQGALGFRVQSYQSGILYPRWAVWTRGDMGQWIGSKIAKPTYHTGHSRPDRQFPIPVRLTVGVINRTGNNAYKADYLEWEKRRAILMKDVFHLTSFSKTLAQLDLAVRHASID